MKKKYLEFFVAAFAFSLFAAGCDQTASEAGPNTPPVEGTSAALAEQPAVEIDAYAGPGFNLATPEGREAAQSSLGQGWHGIEEGLVWQAASVADMTLTVPAGMERKATIYLDAFLPNPGMSTELDVALDGGEAQSYTLENGATKKVVTLDLPASERPSTHTVIFTTSELQSPSEEIEGNTDTRKLGISLLRVDVEAN